MATKTGTTVDKATLRKSMLALRGHLSAEGLAAASEAVAAYGVDWLIAAGAPRSGYVSSYRAIGSEIDTQPLERALLSAGFSLCLPVMAGKSKPLQFRRYELGDTLISTLWGIRQPSTTAAIIVPDVLLVPLLAVDAVGNRLGYGGGFYDRTLAALRQSRSIIAVGLALDDSRIDAVPQCDYDQRLDWVLTPSGPVPCS